MLMDEYYSDKPFSYGGKYRLYEYFSKKKVNDMISKSDIYIIDLSNVKNRGSIHRFMFIIDVNYSNLM